ncbi:hypothetical protein SDC9_203567 [bioreactor metagenome]|uniref:Uncharacterized protein n=1 Tax=bioreactor metagenome TaxID=1076179 RepID=A0A645J8Q1_9ZZZZ
MGTFGCDFAHVHQRFGALRQFIYRFDEFFAGEVFFFDQNGGTGGRQLQRVVILVIFSDVG